MKIYLKNISLDDLYGDDIITIAFNLGCDYKEPEKIANKYLLDGDLNKVYEEQRKIDDEYDIKYTKFIHDVIDWLYKHDYLEERDD